MKQNKDITQTPRYQLKVENLKKRPVYALQAELIHELVVGRQWAIDAVLDAIDARERAWGKIERMKVFDVAATYGRLSAVKRMSEKFKFGEQASSMNCAQEIIQAFDSATLHGHYRVADYCLTLGAHPDYMVGNNKSQKAFYAAIEENNFYKMDYLIKAGADPSYHLNYAVSLGNKPVIDHLLSKGADINVASEGFWTPLLTAVQYRNNDLALYLLAKGADPRGTSSEGEILYRAVGDNNIEIVDALLNLGLKPSQNDIDLAKYHKHEVLIEKLQKYLPQTPPPLAPKF